MNVRRIVVAVTSVIVAAIVMLIVTRNNPDDRQNAAEDPAQPDVVLAHASDHLPNTTASDWVTYADHVVVATAIDEAELSPTAAELERGEGSIGRDVTLRVDDVVWSREGAPEPAPSQWIRGSAGWQFSGYDPDNRVKFAVHDGPRVEVGHTYIIAIVWECVVRPDGDGREVVEPDWRELGQGSTVPYDGGAIGQGELEGRLQTAEDAAQAKSPDEPNFALEDELAGQDAGVLAESLHAATPSAREFTMRPGDGCG